MSNEHKLIARRMGEQKLREADGWWSAWRTALHRYRTWAMIFISKEYEIQMAGRSMAMLSTERLILLLDTRSNASDHMLISMEAARSAIRCASSCEAASRGYFEEYEGRNADLDGDTLINILTNTL